MLVIANNCGGADYYNIHKSKYNNPFMWSLVFADDMIRLINNFCMINWANVEPILLEPQSAIYNGYTYNPTVPGLKIDNTFSLYWPHYLYDATALTPIKKGPDTFYYKNYEYALDKYFTRLKRMFSMSENPAFLIICYKRHGWNADTLDKLDELHTPFKTVIIGPKKETQSVSNIKYIYEPHLEHNENCLPISMVSKHLSTIDLFYTEQI
jgi:uncharacterized protein (DUF1919 family)